MIFKNGDQYPLFQGLIRLLWLPTFVSSTTIKTNDMKNQKLFLTALMWTVSTLAFSQGLTLGVRAGLGSSSISGDPDPYVNINTQKSQSSQLSFNLGIQAMQPLRDKIALQAELFYSREGFKGVESYEGDLEYTQRFSFLSLPVFFRYQLPKHFYVMAGPQLSYLLGATYEYKIYDRPDHVYNEGSTDVSDSMNKFSLGLTPAVGYELKKFNFSIRYYAGLTSLVKSDYNITIKSQVFSMAVSYNLFHLKK
jgi:hypothetical protein